MSWICPDMPLTHFRAFQWNSQVSESMACHLRQGSFVMVVKNMPINKVLHQFNLGTPYHCTGVFVHYDYVYHYSSWTWQMQTWRRGTTCSISLTIRPIISGGFGKFLSNDCWKVQTVRKRGGRKKWVKISTVFRAIYLELITQPG